MKFDYRTWLCRVAIFSATLSGTAFAATLTEELGQYKNALDAQKQNIKDGKEQRPVFDYSREHVRKYDAETGEEAKIQSPFSPETYDPKSDKYGQFIIDKDKVQQSVQRNEARKEERKGKAEFLENDSAVDLIGNLTYTKIQDMENLKAGVVDKQPWSDDYWAIYKGVIAARYADGKFQDLLQETQDWKQLTDYLRGSSATYYTTTATPENSSSLDYLSPAEKYDLMVGHKDSNGQIQWHMRDKMLAEGAQYWSDTTPVETWMGICHGWTPAAIKVDRPTNAINMKIDGVSMAVYPSDIKSLASLLYANGDFEQRFISGRCNDKEPKVDPANGRVLNQDCFDTNPGTWHLVLVNKIGHKHESFVLDATWDYQVWNQPAHSYQYVYFNPVTGQQAETWEQARVLVTDPHDQFKTYRAKKEDGTPKGKWIVGVAMRFVYIAETAPSHNPTDNPNRDRKVAVNYLYDLELMEDGTIIGGEWYKHEHPDFLWMPADGEAGKAVSLGDAGLNEAWDGKGVVPASFVNNAVHATKQKGAPLAAVVNKLVERSTTEGAFVAPLATPAEGLVH